MYVRNSSRLGAQGVVLLLERLFAACDLGYDSGESDRLPQPEAGGMGRGAHFASIAVSADDYTSIETYASRVQRAILQDPPHITDECAGTVIEYHGAAARTIKTSRRG